MCILILGHIQELYVLTVLSVFQLYDLYTGSGTYPGSTDGCPREDDACNNNSVNLPKKCGDHGDCQITDYNTKATICICHSGYSGDNEQSINHDNTLYISNHYINNKYIFTQ
jgi:hypothetical protein